MAQTPRATKNRTQASHADKHDLYQRAVQCVEAEIDFVDHTYKRLRGERATLLREDFGGTANTSCEWVRRRRTNRAVALDIDPKPQAWGRTHNVSALSEEQRSRLHMVRGDVLEAGPFEGRPYDVVLAMNFSYWCFTQRDTLLRYFKAVHASLGPRGVFFLDHYGGSDSMKEMEEPRKIAARPGGGYGSPPFTYVWDQHRYNPITGDLTCYIHFRFADGSEIRRAFTYRWRLWSIPELRDILAEAGFRGVTVYWEGDDGKGGGNGIFRPTLKGEACASYICYITAEK
jgi:SAM-dependent methyltransferase